MTGKFLPAALTPILYRDLISALRFSNNEKNLDNFINAIKNYLNANYVYTFNSFMRAIYAQLIMLKRNDKRKKVVVQRYSCPTFAHAILASGLEIKYCDSNPKTLCFNKNEFDRIDFTEVLAIIVINHFGFPNPMDEIRELCNKYEIYLIEDLGYALGSEFKNKRLGKFGNFSVLNLQEGKAIPIGGGIVTARN